jgi:hypothetical protein
LVAVVVVVLILVPQVGQVEAVLSFCVTPTRSQLLLAQV